MDINLHRHRITYFSTRLCILYPTIIPCNRTLYHNQQLALYYRITHHYTHRILHKTPTHQQKRQHKTIGAPAQRNAINISTCNASWGGGLSTEKCTKHFYGQRKLGWTQQSEVHFNVIESTGIPANQKSIVYKRSTKRIFNF